MCGIVGYIGKRNVVPILLEGLKRLEYRGYDSAGIAIFVDDHLTVVKRAGKITMLESLMAQMDLKGNIGLGHTRWATHGVPNETNAHPHTDCTGRIAIIHNGIIENYPSLKEELIRKGHVFKTETDTESLVHLIEELYDGNLETAVRMALTQVYGTFGIAVVSGREPNMIVAARRGSPLVIGHGLGEYFIASDAAVLIPYTKDVSYLDDNEVVVLRRDGLITKTIDNQLIEKSVESIAFDLEKIEKGGYDHYMLKEIMEQPQTIADSLRGRLLPDEGIARLGGLRHEIDSLLHARRIIITACGTSWHSGLIGEYMLEEFVRTPVEVDYASEFRYRDPVLDHDTVVIAVSQSGETADTLAAVREAKQKGCKVYGICNVVGSSIARESDAGVYLHCGPEIGVASTKAFTSQVTVLALMTLFLARMKSMSAAKGREMVQELQAIPNKVAQILQTSESIKSIAEQYLYCRNFLYLGRGYNFPVALEGALKLKEVSYIHAEGYPAAEMKHGPIALIDESMPVVFIAIQDSTYEKVLNNIAEVRARQGRVIAVATQGDKEIRHCVDHVIYVPPTLECLTPILTIIPLQLLAYHMAVIRGCDVDQPRNLAKSVTVE
ncbi:MAG: glutamine--fructose-6-phosphate transaminase (isomerizing) [Candidatus Latescibacteria bacterium]|nr:glutamine--fructose-6-phosphate transaminase (isomerizing) [Candidatus Latescibacterota bacterium]